MEQQVLREKEEERERELGTQELQRRRRILLDQDNALAQQEEIVNQNWEILRGAKRKNFPRMLMTSNKAYRIGFT